MPLDAFDRLIDERRGRWLDELRDFCGIPSETGRLDQLRRAATWTADRLRTAGFVVEVIEGEGEEDAEGAPPVVVGETGSGSRTLICVQHYDVQPADPLELWTAPPYEPSLRDGHLYARGVADNKGHLLLRLQAIEAYREALGELPCRVRFLVEGEEESSSRHLGRVLRRRPDLVAGDGALQEGGGLDAEERPLLICGVRGILYVELSVRTLAYDAHSGAASLLPNAAWRLVEALATLRQPDGTVTIDGFEEDVLAPTPDQLEHLRTLPFEEARIKSMYGCDRFVGDLTGLDAQVAQLFRPTCNVAGIWSGWTGKGAKTITPAQAHAKLDMRLVPTQDPQRIESALRAHLDRRGFEHVAIENLGGSHPYWTSVRDPLVDAADLATADVFGQPGVRMFSSPGTAPMYEVCAPNRLPLVGIGFAHAGTRAHAPDENVRLDLIWKAARVLGRFLPAFAGDQRRA